MKNKSTGFRKTTGKAGGDRPVGVAKAVARRPKEEERRRAGRRTRLKRYGVFSVLGIESTKYAFYAPDNHPFYRSAPVE